VRLEGSLDAFSLPDIFSLLSMTKKTGGLHLRRADAHGVVWLGDGLISGGASDLSRLSLGRRLAGSGRVADENLQAAVEQVTGDAEVGLARALRDSQAIDEGELHTLVCEHIVDTVFDLMRWTEGVFEFVVDEANVDDVGVTLEVEEVVTDARHRLETWATIDEEIASSDTVLSLTLNPDVDPQVQRDEWSLLALVDGHRTVSDVVTLCGRGEYAVVVALAELVTKGLVRTDESEGVIALQRRQDLVGTLETEGASTTSILADVLSDNQAAEVEPVDVGAVSDESADDEDDDEDEDDDIQVAEVSELPRPSGAPLFASVSGPEHPEPLAAAVAGGGIVPAAVPSGAIERDPSVNKSLLLRLIAGVRGL
jgi:hypothetical protein